jgi:hypothetical protein
MVWPNHSRGTANKYLILSSPAGSPALNLEQLTISNKRTRQATRAEPSDYNGKILLSEVGGAFSLSWGRGERSRAVRKSTASGCDNGAGARFLALLFFGEVRINTSGAEQISLLRRFMTKIAYMTFSCIISESQMSPRHHTEVNAAPKAKDSGIWCNQ